MIGRRTTKAVGTTMPADAMKQPVLKSVLPALSAVLLASALVLSAAALLLAAGCGSLPRVHYYTFSAPSPESSAPADTSRLFLRVERLTVAEPYDGRRIVYRPSGNEVSFWDFHQWAGPPGRMITARVAEGLRRSGLFEGVDSFPYSWRDADLVLRGAVLAFEEVDRQDGWYGHAKLFLELTEPGTVGALWSSKMEAEKKSSGRNPKALVEALSGALDEAILEAEGQMAEALRGRSR